MSPVISGGNAKITKSSKSNFSGLRGRMEVGVDALDRYGFVGCAWHFLGCFASACTYVHALENFWSKMANLAATCPRAWLVGATPFGSGLIWKICQDANYLANAPYYVLIRPLDRILWFGENSSQRIILGQKFCFLLSFGKNEVFCPKMILEELFSPHHKMSSRCRIEA